MARVLCLFLCVLCVEVYGQFGFFPQREQHRQSPFMLIPNRVRDTISNILHRPKNNGPITDNQMNPNVMVQTRPVVFPTNYPAEAPNDFTNQGNQDFTNQGNQQPDFTGQGNGFTGQDNQGNQGNQDFTGQGNGFTSQGNQDLTGQGNLENQSNNQGSTQSDAVNFDTPETPNIIPIQEDIPNDPVNFDDAPKETTPVTSAPKETPVTFAPVPGTEATTKAEFVPETGSRNNFNFDGAPVFSNPCTTIDGDQGNCIDVYKCKPFVNILKESRTNPAAVRMLRQAHCGFEGNNPKVCCPVPGLPNTPTPAPTTTTTTTTTKTTTTQATPTGKSSGGGDFVALPQPPVCGVSNTTLSRVVGGVNAKLGAFPWMALLGYKRGSDTRWLCGGSIISSRHILTAAHCIHNHEDDLYVVRLGELDLAREDEGATPIDVLLKDKIKHEQYNPKAFTNDIGILVMDKEVQFTDLIKPICIPMDSELRARSFEDYNPLIAGWGDTEFRGPQATHLQVLQLPVVSNEFCATAYKQYKAQTIDSRVLCAGYKQGGKDACQGDSGGPLMQPIWNAQKYTTYIYQIGVVSYGKKCAEAGFPGVYSRVTHFVPWIEEKVSGARR